MERVRAFARRNAAAILAVSAYALFAFVPAVGSLASGRPFGGDVADYLLTARVLATHGSNTFAYPYPLLPALYIPLASSSGSNPLSVYGAADLLSPALIVAAFVAAYTWLRTVTRSVPSGLVGAAVIGTYPLLLDEIGWGGQSQLLAIALGLGALATLASIWERERPVWLAAIAGGLLGLAFLAEPYAAAFFAVLVGVRVIHGYGPRLFSPQHFPWIAALFLPPLLLGAGVAAYDFRLFAYGATSPLVAGFTTPGLFPALADRLTFGYQVLLIVYAGLIVLYLLQRPELRALGLDDAPWVVASGIAFALQFLLLTSLVFADRALYFAPVPLSLLAASASAPFGSRAALPGSASGPEAREAWGAGNSRPAASSRRADRPRHRAKLTHPNALAFASVVLLLLVQVAAASQTYPSSLVFYSLSPSTVSALRSLERQNGSVLLVSGPPVWFPAALATGRPLYPAAQPGWFIAGPQVAATILATTLASGVAWIDAGPLKIVDAEPAWGQPSPGLFVFRYPDFVDLLRMNDSLLTGTFSPLSDRLVNSTFSLFPGARVTPSYSGPSFARQYALPFVTVSKTVSVLAGGVVDIGLRYQFEDSVPRSISIPLLSDLGASATLAAPSPETIVATVRADYKNGWTVADFDASVTVKSTASGPGLVAASAGGTGGPVLVVSQSFAGPANATVGYDIRIRVANLAVTSPELVLEPQTLMQTGIRVALIEKSLDPDVASRFQRDPAWGLAFENAAFWEFQARLGAASAS